jgi:hypothetical protein
MLRILTIISLGFLFVFNSELHAQIADDSVKKCAKAAGEDAIYLKDFIV